jgi:hypothetical protein
MSEQQQGGEPKPSKALRLIFRFEGKDVRLVSQTPVEKILPPTDPLSEYEGEQGFWVEVRSRQDETLHRRVMHDPLQQDLEVFSPDSERSVFRAPVETPSGIFTVLVPDLDEADHVALMSSTTTARGREAAAGGPATELARFSLRFASEGGGA